MPTPLKEKNMGKPDKTWVAQCVHPDGQYEEITLDQLVDFMPEHPKDFKANVKYIIRSKKWTKVKDKWQRFKVFILRIAETAEQLKTGGRLKLPRLNPTSADELGSESEIERQNLKAPRESKADAEKKKRKAKSEVENEMASFVSALQTPGPSPQSCGKQDVQKKQKSSNCSDSFNSSASKPSSSSSKSPRSQSKEVKKSFFEQLRLPLPSKLTADGIQSTTINAFPVSNLNVSETSQSLSFSSLSSNIQCGSPGSTLSVSSSSVTNNSSSHLNLMRNASQTTSSGFVSCGSDPMISSNTSVVRALISTNKPHELISEQVGDSLSTTPFDENNLYMPDGQPIQFITEGPSGNIIEIQYEDQELKLKEALAEAEKAKAEAVFWKEKAQKEESMRQAQMGDASIMAVLDAMKNEMAEMKSQLQTVLGNTTARELSVPRSTAPSTAPSTAASSSSISSTLREEELVPGLPICRRSKESMSTATKKREWCRALLLGCFSREEAQNFVSRVHERSKDSRVPFPPNFESAAKAHYASFLERTGFSGDSNELLKASSTVMAELTKVARDLRGNRNKQRKDPKVSTPSTPSTSSTTTPLEVGVSTPTPLESNDEEEEAEGTSSRD